MNLNYQSRGFEWLWLAVVFLSAAFFNLYNLGGFGFWGDELYHVFAAQSLIENGTPAFSGGFEYLRALPFTYMVAASFELLGISEFSARLPSVFFGLLFLFTSALVVRHIVEGYTAIIYAVIISFSPFALQVVRQCRMYTTFLFFFFFSILLLWAALNRFDLFCGHGPAYRCLPRVLRDRKFLAALAGSAACLSVAATLHALALSVVAVVPVYCFGMLLYTASTKGWKVALMSIYGLMLALCACGLIVAAIEHQRMASLIQGAFGLPKWATFMKSQMTSNFYRYYFENNFPALFFIYPIATFWLIKEKPALGILTLSCFLPLFLLHSYAFPLKQERYIYHAFPFFALTNAFFIRRFLQEAWARMWQLYPTRQGLFRLALAAAFLGGAYVFFYPWLAQSRTEMFQARWSSDWKHFAEQYRPVIEARHTTVISTSQNHFYYYFGRRPDFYLRASYRPGDVDAEFGLNSETIYTLDQLQDAVEKHPNVILITEYGLGNRDYYTDEMARFIEDRMINVHDKGGFMKVYFPK